MNTAQEIAAKQMDLFLSTNKDLLACIRETPEEIFRRTSAAASLDQDTRDDLERYATIVDQENSYARKVAREDLARTIYASIARHFIELFQNGTFHFAMRLTDAADQQQLELRYLTGQLPRPAPAPKPLSPAQLLEKEVIEDFAGVKSDDPTKRKPPLSANAMRKKINGNSAYRVMYERLAETDKLKSQATTLHDIVGG